MKFRELDSVLGIQQATTGKKRKAPMDQDDTDDSDDETDPNCDEEGWDTESEDGFEDYEFCDDEEEDVWDVSDGLVADRIADLSSPFLRDVLSPTPLSIPVAQKPAKPVAVARREPQEVVWKI